MITDLLTKTIELPVWFLLVLPTLTQLTVDASKYITKQLFNMF